MKQSRAYFLAVAIALAMCAAGAARADSIFALNLLGERVDVGDARIVALGGFVQTVDDSLGVLQYNPAALAWMKRFSFGTAGYFTSDLNKSEDLTNRKNGTTFSQLLFAFPIYRDRVTAGVGFRGRYDPDGQFTVPGQTSEGDAFNDHYQRSGGLFAVPFQVAFDAGNYAKIGVFYSLERGKIQETWIKDFVEPTFADATSDRERVFRGHCLGGGFVSRPTKSLSIGLTYESKIDYDVDVTERFTSTSADTQSTEKATMPARLTASASFRLSAMTFFVGGSLCDFRKFKGIGFPEQHLAEEKIGSLGIEYRLGDAHVPLRGSFTYEQLPFLLPAGQNVTRIGFAVGTGRVMRGGRGKVDIALQFANTGSVATNTYSDRSVRFALSITGSEDWKRQRDRRE